MVWIGFLALLALFLGLHVLPFAGGVRAGLEARVGEKGYRLGYSVLSLIGLVGAFLLAGRAPVVALWPVGETVRWLALVLTLPAFVLIAAAYLGGKGWRLARHPMLAGFGLWAFAHFLVAGTLAHAILFAALAAYAPLAMLLSDRRDRARDPEAWAARGGSGRLVPFWGLLRGDGLEGFHPRALGAGMAAWLVLLLLHPWLFGASPLPPGLLG